MRLPLKYFKVHVLCIKGPYRNFEKQVRIIIPSHLGWQLLVTTPILQDSWLERG